MKRKRLRKFTTADFARWGRRGGQQKSAAKTKGAHKAARISALLRRRRGRQSKAGG